MAKRGLFGSIISVILLSIVVFFLLYLFAPEAAQQFFGTSIRDSKVSESSNVIMDIAASSGEYTQEQLEKLEEYLKSGKAKNTLVKIGTITSEGAKEFVNTVKDSLWR